METYKIDFYTLRCITGFLTIVCLLICKIKKKRFISKINIFSKILRHLFSVDKLLVENRLGISADAAPCGKFSNFFLV